MATEADARLVFRKGKVCEWHGEVVEHPGKSTDCPWCYGPTDLLRILPVGAVTANKNPHAAALGRLGGLKGGRARAAALSPKERRAIAIKAAKARWKKANSS